MNLNPHNIRFPQPERFAYQGGELPSDPRALSQLFAAQHSSGRSLRTANNPYVRTYEKSRRLERMAQRAAKNRMRCHD